MTMKWEGAVAAIALICTAGVISAQEPPANEISRRALERDAGEAVNWGMPIVSFEAMRRGYFALGAKYNDILYLSKPADWKLQITTPNSSSLYVYFNYNLKDGPVVVELPAAVGAGLFGSILDAWQMPLTDVGPEGADQGKGGKYLLLPPDYKGQTPAGDFAIRSATYNGYAAFRAIPKTRSNADTAKALALVKQLRVYPLSQEANPPQQRYIDISGKLFDGIARMDESFYDVLAKMVNEEPVQTRDLAAMGQLRTIGVEKGKPFQPDAATRGILKQTVADGHDELMEENARVVPYWPTAKWGTPAYMAIGAKTAFSFQTHHFLDIDGRGALYYIACALPKKLGAASFYLSVAIDDQNQPFDGSKTYHLHVPANVPARQFWAVTVYDLETAGFIRESPKTEVNSYQKPQKNADGSVEVYFGPKAPTGKETNWVYTAPGKRWFSIFRFYGPEPALRDKSWALPDIEQGEQSISAERKQH